MRLRELAHARPRFGYLRLHLLLRREGWFVNRKRVRQLPTGRIATPASVPPAAAHGVTSRRGTGPDGASAALERGFRTRAVVRRPAVPESLRSRWLGSRESG